MWVECGIEFLYHLRIPKFTCKQRSFSLTNVIRKIQRRAVHEGRSLGPKIYHRTAVFREPPHLKYFLNWSSHSWDMAIFGYWPENEAKSGFFLTSEFQKDIRRTLKTNIFAGFWNFPAFFSHMFRTEKRAGHFKALKNRGLEICCNIFFSLNYNTEQTNQILENWITVFHCHA